MLELAVICSLALIAIAQWLDWKAGIEERQFSRHYHRFGA